MKCLTNDHSSQIELFQQLSIYHIKPIINFTGILFYLKYCLRI